MDEHPSHRPAPGAPVASDATAVAVLAVVFFMWGFITVLNDVLIPHLKSIFALDYAQVMLVQSTFFGAYFLMSLPAGKVLTRVGYRASIIGGLIVSAIGATTFLPAAQAHSSPLFLLAFFVLATGVTLMEVAATPYVSFLGPAHLASSRLNLVEAFNSLGTMLAPAIGGMLILSAATLGAAELAHLAPAARAAYRVGSIHRVQGLYFAVSMALLALAIVASRLRLPRFDTVAAADTAAPGFADALKLRRVWLAMMAIFVYVGAEVSIGSFMVNYLAQPEIGHLREARAATLVSLYWGGAMLGRFVGSRLLTRIDTRRLLAAHAMIAAALVVTTMLATGYVAVVAVVAVGLFNSIMFPGIFVLGIEGLGPLVSVVSSLLVMAVVGGAIMPLAQGVIADAVGIHHAFVLPLLGYIYIAYYGLRGSRLK